MQIAIVRKQYSLKKAGAERYCVNLTRQLQRLGHRVTVIGEGIDEDLRDEVEFLPVRVTHTTSWAKNRSFAENCEKVVRQHRFDVVHGLSRTPAVDCFRLTDPLQAHWFNVYYKHPFQRFLQRMNPRHRMLFSIERSIYQSDRVRRIITQSRLDSRLITEYYGVPEEKIRRVYNGVDTTVFHPGVKAEAAAVREELGLPLEEPLLVFAGMDFRRKGLDSLLQALQLLKHSETRLLVLGTGQETFYQRLADQLGVGRRVLFAGRRQAIQRYYAAGDLFILPTIYEPFPNVNLEAMACGVPVLTSATAGGADIIEEGRNGYVVADPQAVHELAERIDQHLSLPTSAKIAMAEFCWETARHMTVEKNARQTLAVFEEVLLEKSRV
jgi:UDP-glucose:(heptosyl)LPS alpha-1,3-glucosyltransferase